MPDTETPTEDHQTSRAARLASAGLTLLGLCWVSACAPGPTARVTVASVASWGAAAAAGLEAGDGLLSWRQGASGGELTSPLDLLWLEEGRAPSGGLELLAERGRRQWKVDLPGGDWGLTTEATRDRRGRALRARIRRDEADGDWYRAALGWQRLARTGSGEGPGPRAWTQARAGRAALKAGLEELAIEAFSAAREGLSSPSSKSGLAFMEGRAWADQGDYPTARAAFLAAAAAARGVDAESPGLAASLERAADCDMRLGDLGSARKQLDQAWSLIADLPSAGPLRARIDGTRGSVEYVARNLVDAALFYRRGLDSLAGARVPFRGWLAVGLGNAAAVSGNLETAEERYLEAASLLEDVDPHNGIAGEAQQRLADFYLRVGHREKAERYYEKVLHRLPPHTSEWTRVWLRLGYLAEARGMDEKAKRHADEARGELDTLETDSMTRADLSKSLATLFDYLGDEEAAERWYLRALDAGRQLGSAYSLGTISDLGDLYERRGDLDAAEALLLEGLELARATAPDGEALPELLANLANVAESRGDLEKALVLGLEGLTRVERLRSEIPSPEDRARYTSVFHDFYPGMAELLVRRGRFGEALELIEKARGRRLRSWIQRRGLRPSAELASEEIHRRRVLDRQLAEALAERSTAGNSREAPAIRHAIRDLKAERLTVTEEILKSDPRFAFLDDPPTLSLARMQEVLDPGVAFLSYVVRDEVTLVFALTRDRIHAEILPLGAADLRRRVSVVRSLIERGRTVEEPEDALLIQAARLYGDLIGPLATTLSPAKRLWISPDGALHDLPFAALVRSVEPLEYLLDWKPCSIVPSLGGVSDERRVARPAENRLEIAAFGDPRVPAPAVRLPAAAREARFVASLFSGASSTYVGEAATKTRALEVLPVARYLHFAVHAELDTQLPFESALVLAPSDDSASDGRLYGWEVLEGATLSAEVVSLSGCQTGLGAAVTGEGLLGLAQAFRFAGARRVLASHWPVGDAAAEPLMESFYRELAAGATAERALHRAQLRLRSARGEDLDLQLAHPYAWAAFSLFGAA